MIKGLFFILLVFCVACEKTVFHESKTFAGGKVVDAATLNLGHTTYLEYCVQCHGQEGKGDGPSSKGLIPPPRNLTQGLYKFGNVPYGELPHDEDFHRIILKGLKGSAMLPWDISQKRLDAVIQYIKTFAPQTWEGADKTLGNKLVLAADPYGPDKKAEAIERGKAVYHVVAQCTTCHKGYVSHQELSEINKKVNGQKLTSFEPDLYQLKPQDGEYNYKVLPPDFTYHELRSVYSFDDIVQRVIYGVTGSGMPGWKDVISDEDIWAVSYYVEELINHKNDPQKRSALMQGMKN